MKKVILVIVVLSFGVSSVFAAGGGLSRQKGRLDRVERIYDELPAEVQEQVDALKDARQSLRDTLKTDYLGVLGEDATAQERAAAITQYKEDFADEIAANRELAKETLETVRENLPERPEVSDEIQALIDEQKEARSELKTALRAHLDALPDDASREDVKAAIAEFNEANAEVIAENKELRQEVRELVKEVKEAENAVKLTAEVSRGEFLSPELAAAREEFRSLRSEMLEKKRERREFLRSLDEEDRKAFLGEVREEVRELKEAKREVRRAAREALEDHEG